MLTLFPEMFGGGVLGHSLAGKARDKGLWHLDVQDIRQAATDKHRTVDDTPFGGGPGMVMRPDIVDRAVREAKAAMPSGSPLVFLSPRGRVFTQAAAHALVSRPGLMLLCGRYEGLDQRVIDAHQLVELSIGDYVLAGGEVAAQVVIEACVRLLPGVMGNAETAGDESFETGLLEHPHYTRPAVWVDPDGLERPVPEVLQSGHHGRIEAWRHEQARLLTEQRRPDLYQRWLRAQAAGRPPEPPPPTDAPSPADPAQEPQA